MAQHDYNIANQGFSSFRSDLNNALSAIQTTNSGTSRPTGAVAGQLWLDTTSATTPTLKYYDGADDISLATIDHTANTVNWLDSTVSITGLSTTATGTVLTLSDSANTTTVNLIIDNQKEVRFRETTANGTNYVGLKAPASLSADLTFTLPSADGTNGQALITNGSGVLSFTTISSGLSWDSTVKTASTFTAVVNKGYFVDTTSNAITCTLPASATAGDVLAFVDYARNFATNKLTLNQNSLKFQGFTTPNPEYNTTGQSIQLVYSGATKGWIPFSDDDVTDEVPQTYSSDFLIVAGGGAGGGGYYGGGGGAGGYRYFTSQTLTDNATYTVTVGAGGTGSAGSGTNGVNSSISGTGISYTSAGGGGGGKSAGGLAGGSGGGCGDGAGAGGAGNTPSVSPSQGFAGGGGIGNGGGGGGSSQVGANPPSGSPHGGVGGNGTANSITGSSVTYAGGGGGGSYDQTRAGGTGGGGTGGNYLPSLGATAGTTNTGGGGGAAGDLLSGASGGSGIVILRVLTTDYSGTTTGSPTVTTDGSYKVIKFTGSGSYTA